VYFLLVYCDILIREQQQHYKLTVFTCVSVISELVSEETVAVVTSRKIVTLLFTLRCW